MTKHSPYCVCCCGHIAASHKSYGSWRVTDSNPCISKLCQCRDFKCVQGDRRLGMSIAGDLISVDIQADLQGQRDVVLPAGLWKREREGRAKAERGAGDAYEKGFGVGYKLGFEDASAAYN